jgi:hypothetical protein
MKCVIALAMILVAAPAMAQQWQIDQMPLGGGWYDSTIRGPNGQRITGTTVPMGGGWSDTTYHDNYGNRLNCTTMPMGGGWSNTSCH